MTLNNRSNYLSSPLTFPTFKRKTTANGRRLRIVLYSHDTMGLGHKRRNLLIAQTLGDSALDADILLISGMRDASNVPTPDGVDTLTLPALHKRPDGQYEARRMSLPLEEIIELRSQLILTAIKGFQPDIFIVDNVPRGAGQELSPTLDYLKRAKAFRQRNALPTTRCVLGLRDVLDTPAAVQRDWQKANNIDAIRRYYDAVWIYGDADLYDMRTEYDFPSDIVAKMQPLGYLNQRTRLNFVNPEHDPLEQLSLPKNDEIVLCLVGGGQDGAALATAFVQASFPVGTTGILLTGPFMPDDVKKQLYAQAERNVQCRIMDYIEEPTLLLERANRVISMGGYNTTCEILSFQKTALIVPRVTPRLEQWIRADRLQKRGMIDVLHPEEVCAAALSQWLHRAVPTEHPTKTLNLCGLDNLLIALQNLLREPVPMPVSLPLSRPLALSKSS